jgi:hypothetical protein
MHAIATRGVESWRKMIGVLNAYFLAAMLWFLTCAHRFDFGVVVVFTCLFWPVDLVRGLYRGAREWWRS